MNIQAEFAELNDMTTNVFSYLNAAPQRSRMSRQVRSRRNTAKGNLAAFDFGTAWSFS